MSLIDAFKRKTRRAVETVAATPAILKKELADARATELGVAKSRARRIMTLEEVRPAIVKAKVAREAPRPTNVAIRDKRGRAMVYWTDGSLRHLPEGGGA